MGQTAWSCELGRLYDGWMPRIACWSCGRQLYTVAPLESLFTEERRCPRCGAFLNNDRREADRRAQIRRQNPTDEPGPPVEGERRVEERRRGRRRGGSGEERDPEGGWLE
jgi:ribosomal protein S27AE